MASAVDPKSKRRVIVVFNGTESTKERKEEGIKLTKWALNGFKNKVFIDKERDTYTVPVLFGDVSVVKAVPKENLRLTVEKLADPKIVTEFVAIPNLEAPVNSGDLVGNIKVTMDGKPYKIIDVVANGSVNELGAFKRFIAKTKHKFNNRN